MKSRNDLSRGKDKSRNTILSSKQSTNHQISDFSNYGTTRTTQKRNKEILSQRNISPWSSKMHSMEHSQKLEMNTRKYINRQNLHMNARKKQLSSQIQQMQFLESKFL